MRPTKEPNKGHGADAQSARHMPSVRRLDTMGELAFAVAVFATPLLLLPIVLRRDPIASRSSVFALFVVPFVGAVTYCLLPPRLGFGAVVVGYPVALVSLGFWAALLAASGVLILRRTPLFAWTVFSSVLGAAVSGAAVGAGFMLVYSLADRVVSPGMDMIAVQRCAAAGLAGGAVAGAFAGYDLHSQKAGIAA